MDKKTTYPDHNSHTHPTMKSISSVQYEVFNSKYLSGFRKHILYRGKIEMHIFDPNKASMCLNYEKKVCLSKNECLKHVK